MPELRWTLLILGALFIAGLAIWEIRRQRHARGQTLDKGMDRSGADPRFGESGDEQGRFTGLDSFGVGGGRGDSRDGQRVYREPTLTFPDTQPRHDPMAELRVVEIEDKELTGLRVDDETAVDAFSMHADDRRGSFGDRRSDDRADDPSDIGSDRVDLGDDEESEPRDLSDSDDVEKPASATPIIPRLAPAEPMIADRRFASGETGVVTGDRAAGTPGDSVPGTAPQDLDEGVLGPARAVGEVPTHEPTHADDESASAHADAPAKPFNVDTNAFAVSEPIVEWPEDHTRKIIALRLVSGGGERFQGRAVRQALAAEGFLLGKFDIFHKPGPDSRAVLSAASLTKPGSFALSTMDSQRFGGLSLFAVLPGPLSPTATFDELLITARSLNDRLRGALQDERGEPLTPVRSANIRDSLTAQATAAAPVVGPASGAAPTGSGSDAS